LSNITHYAECIANMLSEMNDISFGKMQAQCNTYGKNLYYRCRTHDLDTNAAPIPDDKLELPLIGWLIQSSLECPEWRSKGTARASADDGSVSMGAQEADCGRIARPKLLHHVWARTRKRKDYQVIVDLATTFIDILSVPREGQWALFTQAESRL
jgi:hypothetical protein